MKQNNIQITKRTIDKTREETSGFIAKIEELTLFNERSLQELRKAKHMKQVQYYFAALLIQDICLFGVSSAFHSATSLNP